jgi:hypothetical protein
MINRLALILDDLAIHLSSHATLHKEQMMPAMMADTNSFYCQAAPVLANTTLNRIHLCLFKPILYISPKIYRTLSLKSKTRDGTRFDAPVLVIIQMYSAKSLLTTSLWQQAGISPRIYLQ